MDEKNAPSGMPRADFVTSLLLITLGVGVTVLSVQMPRLEHRGINPYTVPGIVPGILGVLITAMSVTLLVRSISRHGYRLGINREWMRAASRSDLVRRIFVTVSICIMYALGLVGLVPYPVATFLFVVLFIVLFEYDRRLPLRRQRRTITLALLEAILTAVLVSALFRYLFLVRLP